MRMNKGLAYKLANLLVLLAAAGFFFYEYGDFGGLAAGEMPLSLAMLAVTAILVHLAKSGRVSKVLVTFFANRPFRIMLPAFLLLATAASAIAKGVYDRVRAAIGRGRA